MVFTVSNKPQALYDASEVYTKNATRELKKAVAPHTYVLPPAFQAYREKGQNAKDWVRRYCTLTEAKIGLKILIESADKELKSYSTQLRHEKDERDNIAKQLDGFACLAEVPESCSMLYERIDMEAELKAAQKNSGIKHSNAELRSYHEEKQECQGALQRRESRLTALSNPPAVAQKGRSKDKKSGHDDRSRSDLHKQKKILRAKIAETQTDIATLDKSFSDTQRKLDAQLAALAPQQLALATLIGKLTLAGITIEEQDEIITLLRQLDEVTDRHDQTTSLLEQGKMAPLYYPNGDICLSMGPHSEQQLSSLLTQVRQALSETNTLLKRQVGLHNLKSTRHSGAFHGVRFAPKRQWYDEQQLRSSDAHSELPNLPAPGLEDAPAIPATPRFSRLVTLPPTLADDGAVPDDAPVTDKGKEAAAPPARQEPSGSAGRLEVIEQSHAGSDDSDIDSDDSDHADEAQPAPAPSNALVHIGRPARPRSAEAATSDEPGNTSVSPAAAFPLMGTTQLVLMPPPPAPAPSKTPSTAREMVVSKALVNTSTKSKGKGKAVPDVATSRSEPTPARPAKAATAAARLLPKASDRPGAYHFGASDLDWEWQKMRVEFRVPPPQSELPADAIDIASVRDGGNLRMLSDAPYQEPEPAAKPAAAPSYSSSYTLGSNALRDKQTPPAQVPQPTSKRDATDPQFQDKGRRATMPERHQAEPGMAPPRTTMPRQAPEAAGASRPQPAPRQPAREHVRDETPAVHPMPASFLPPDPRVPWSAVSTLADLPPAMRNALTLAAMRNEFWMTMWHTDLSRSTFGLVKLYYVVRDNIPVSSSFPLSPPGTPKPTYYRIYPGDPYCHVMEILPPRAAAAAPPGFQPAPMPSDTTYSPSDPRTTDPNSPRFVAPDRPSPFGRREVPEPVRRQKERVETTFSDNDNVEPDPRPSQSRRSDKSRHKPHRYARKPAPRSGESSHKHQQTRGHAGNMWTEGVAVDQPSVIEVNPIDLGSRPPLAVLGSALPALARQRALDAIIAGMRDMGMPVPSHPERTLQVPNQDWHKHIEKLLDDPGEINKPEFTDAKPLLSRGKAIIDSLIKMGFDLRMLNDLHVELSYLWNSAESDGRLPTSAATANASRIERPPEFAAAFEVLCDKLVGDDRRRNHHSYEKMEPAERDAELQAKRISLLATDREPYADYLRKKYQNVFSLDMDAPMLKPMWGRVRNKLNTYLIDLAANAVTETVAFKGYGTEQKQRLLNHLALQKDGLYDAGIAKIPGFQRLFEQRLDAKVYNLSQSAPDKMATEEMSTAQRSNLRGELMGSEGKKLHEQYMLDSEFGPILRPVKEQLGANTWSSTIDELFRQLAPAK